ncbi:hypothetical protein [Syntrophomonas zehnderi]|uniref:hypothetical protein n=1 Tax=Syntrophomonas zehnderi TaxID=404335 RepID=UPI001A9A5C37|nr:hypothetical protein [Syntrophomonas zehnderi]
MYFFIHAQYPPFLLHLLKLSLLYFVLAFSIGGMLGTAMAAILKSRRLAVYSLTLIFLFLNTRATEALFRTPYLLFNSYGGEKLLYNIKDFFTIVPLELGSTFEVAPLYGFPMEPYRWMLAVFWLLFPLTLILYECIAGKKKKMILAVSSLLLLLAVGLFSLRGSTLLMDMRTTSFVIGDNMYYTEMGHGPAVLAENPKKFAIKKYIMDFTVSNELHAVVDLTVDNPNLEKYDFTLYHGYKLKSISTADGKPVPFVREEDYLTVSPAPDTDRLVFRYYGKSPKYYANCQGITLPGYFAYYPKAGKHEIWSQVNNSYVFDLPSTDSEYIVSIHSNLKVFCNLEGNNNSFQGKSNGLTLLAGMYSQVADKLYAEPIREDAPVPNAAMIRKADASITEACKRLQRSPEPFLIGDRKIFQVPRTFHLNSQTESAVVMSDHITTDGIYDGKNFAMEIMQAHFNQQREPVFSSCYLSCLFDSLNKNDPLVKTRMNHVSLLKELDEFLYLESQVNSITPEKLRTLPEPEIVEYSKRKQRYDEMFLTTHLKTAYYLFYQSPCKEDNLRAYFDFFTSDSKEHYLDLAEKLLREEVEHADR